MMWRLAWALWYRASAPRSRPYWDHVRLPYLDSAEVGRLPKVIGAYPGAWAALQRQERR